MVGGMEEEVEGTGKGRGGMYQVGGGRDGVACSELEESGLDVSSSGKGQGRVRRDRVACIE